MPPSPGFYPGNIGRNHGKFHRGREKAKPSDLQTPPPIQQTSTCSLFLVGPEREQQLLTNTLIPLILAYPQRRARPDNRTTELYDLSAVRLPGVKATWQSCCILKISGPLQASVFCRHICRIRVSQKTCASEHAGRLPEQPPRKRSQTPRSYPAWLLR
jgi:hypothetical protein